MAADLADVLRRTHPAGLGADADLAVLAGDPGRGCFRHGKVVCTMGDPGRDADRGDLLPVKVAVRAAGGGS